MPAVNRRKPAVGTPLEARRVATRRKLTLNTHPNHAAATTARARRRRQRPVGGQECRQVLILVKVQRAQAPRHLPQVNRDVELARRQRIPIRRRLRPLKRPLRVSHRRHLSPADARDEECILAKQGGHLLQRSRRSHFRPRNAPGHPSAFLYLPGSPGSSWGKWRVPTPH